MKKNLFFFYFFLFSTFFSVSSGGTDVIIQDPVAQIIKEFGSIETATKGKKLKQFFLGSTLRLSTEETIKEYKFQEKKYEVFEEGKLIETGKWKVSGLLKNQIKLKADGKIKSYYLKKINNKDVIYHFDNFPGKEGTKKTLAKIEVLTKNEVTKIVKKEKEPKKEKTKIVKKKEKPKKKKVKKEKKTKKEKTQIVKKKKKNKKESKNKKKYRYVELKENEIKKLKKYEELSQKIEIISSEDNSIEITKAVADIKVGQYVAAKHCAKNNLFAYAFKDSGFGSWYEPPFKRAKFFYCTDELIFVNPFTNKEVKWTNYDKQIYYKNPKEHLFLYRKMRSIYKIALEKEKKIHPKHFKADPFKIVYKDENVIHIKGYPVGDLNKERYIANKHCSSLNKKYYFFEDSFLQGRFGTQLFHCSDKHLSQNPLSGLPLIYVSGSENYSAASNQGNVLDASQMLKFNSTNNITYLYFESSDNLMKSLELLYRAYDQNVEADKLKAQIDYNRESKYSEQEKLSSTRSIIDTSSKEINAQIIDTSKVLSDSGRDYYQKSLPYAFKAAESSYKLIVTIKDTFEKGSQGGESFLNYANEFIGFFTIAKDIPKLASDIFKTSQLVFSGAKSKKIKDNNNLGKALDDLNLDV